MGGDPQRGRSARAFALALARQPPNKLLVQLIYEMLLVYQQFPRQRNLISLTTKQIGKMTTIPTYRFSTVMENQLSERFIFPLLIFTAIYKNITRVANTIRKKRVNLAEVESE